MQSDICCNNMILVTNFDCLDCLCYSQAQRCFTGKVLLQVLRREIIKSGESNIQQPVNLKRLLWNAQRVFDKEQGAGKTQASKAQIA